MPWQLCEVPGVCCAWLLCAGSLSCPVDASLAAQIVHRKIPTARWSCAGKSPRPKVDPETPAFWCLSRNPQSVALLGRGVGSRLDMAPRQATSQVCLKPERLAAQARCRSRAPIQPSRQTRASGSSAGGALLRHCAVPSSSAMSSMFRVSINVSAERRRDGWFSCQITKFVLHSEFVGIFLGQARYLLRSGNGIGK